MKSIVLVFLRVNHTYIIIGLVYTKMTAGKQVYNFYKHVSCLYIFLISIVYRLSIRYNCIVGLCKQMLNS